MTKNILTDSDAKFLEAIGIAPDDETVILTPFGPAPERDFYPAFVYWRNEALRQERLAAYSWGAWLIAVCMASVVAICWYTRP